jgi:3-hydroxyisobutyrate dehydrogenase-like beta-hydroxyacid dehydrogenase
MTATSKLGFVGLGHMGGNMAARFLGAGYPVYGEARSRERAEHLLDEGLTWCETPRELAEAVDIVLTSIPDDAALEDVAPGPDGILEGLEQGKVWVDLARSARAPAARWPSECGSVGRPCSTRRCPAASPRCRRGR